MEAEGGSAGHPGARVTRTSELGVIDVMDQHLVELPTSTLLRRKTT